MALHQTNAVSRSGEGGGGGEKPEAVADATVWWGLCLHAYQNIPTGQASSFSWYLIGFELFVLFEQAPKENQLPAWPLLDAMGVIHGSYPPHYRETQSTSNALCAEASRLEKLMEGREMHNFLSVQWVLPLFVNKPCQFYSSDPKVGKWNWHGSFKKLRILHTYTVSSPYPLGLGSWKT